MKWRSNPEGARPDGPGSTQQPARMASLDLLRLAAALSVLAYHYLFRGNAGTDGLMATGFPSAAPFAVFGFTGLHLFFILSGFVIAWSAEGRSFRQFALARVIRIYPAFVLCMSITFVVMLLAGRPEFPASMMQYLANLLIFAPALGQPFVEGAYWTIVLEIIFYGWISLTVALRLFDRHLVAISILWLMLAILNEVWLNSGIVRAAFLTSFIAYFLSGALAWHMLRNGVSALSLGAWLMNVLATFFTMTGQHTFIVGHYGVDPGLHALLIANLATHGLFLAGLLFAGAVPASRLVLALGGMTYPLYLLHQQIGYVSIDLMAPHLGNWTAAATVTIVLAGASYAIWNWYERPLQRYLKRYLEDRMAPEPRPIPAE